MVLLLPPAPAARVLLGRALAIFSFWSAAARRRMAVRAPPGGGGDEGRPVLTPVLAPGVPTGEEARGEDCAKTPPSPCQQGPSRFVNVGRPLSVGGHVSTSPLDTIPSGQRTMMRVAGRNRKRPRRGEGAKEDNCGLRKRNEQAGDRCDG